MTLRPKEVKRVRLGDHLDAGMWEENLGAKKKKKISELAVPLKAATGLP